MPFDCLTQCAFVVRDICWRAIDFQKVYIDYFLDLSFAYKMSEDSKNPILKPRNIQFIIIESSASSFGNNALKFNYMINYLKSADYFSTWINEITLIVAALKKKKKYLNGTFSYFTYSLNFKTCCRTQQEVRFNTRLVFPESEQQKSPEGPLWSGLMVCWRKGLNMNYL